MDHPAIAKVFEAGSTLEGRPYFVMEYVAGISITDYYDKHKLTVRQRMEVFILACEGVQHAHQKAIIHRDLKPSNILVSEVDGKPMPRIIDFGVAKATAQQLTAGTIYTRVGAILGTLDYMSPEQADSAGEDIDTRTDVYSLGVVLYELLVGRCRLILRNWLMMNCYAACASRMHRRRARSYALWVASPRLQRKIAALILLRSPGSYAAIRMPSPSKLYARTEIAKDCAHCSVARRALAPHCLCHPPRIRMDSDPTVQAATRSEIHAVFRRTLYIW